MIRFMSATSARTETYVGHILELCVAQVMRQVEVGRAGSDAVGVGSMDGVGSTDGSTDGEEDSWA